MKRITAIAILAIAAHTATAQSLKPAPGMAGATAAASPAATPQARTGAARVRTAIGGMVQNERWEPVAKIQAYVYSNDTIRASGYADAKGHYETSALMPGTYTLRLVYPQSGRRITVPDVPVKARKVTIVNYRGIEPVGDSTIAYADLAPAAPKK